MTNTQAQRCGHCGAWLLPTDFVHYPVRLGETDSGNPLLGTVIDGKYRLQSVLGRGGLGTVFSAMHIGSLMTVALKLLHPRFTGRPEYRRALLPEARRAATVTHTRCARLLDVGEVEEGVSYLAMELVEGKTLEALMRGGKMAPSHAVDILLQVAEALEAIHAAGLVHCDLSPRNVMVAQRSGQLHVKVLDFGIARSVTLAGDEPAPGSEFTGFVNPAFSAPEVLARGKVDPRADLYSFGTLAWLLLTGSMPIDDTDARRAALAVAAGELRAWPRVPGVPRDLQRLVQACVSREPERRPASATAVRLQLESVRSAGRPKVAGTAVAAAAIVAVSLALGESPPMPFLELETSSDVKLVDPNEAVGALPQALRSVQLAALSFRYGGFDATRLRADVSQGVDVWRIPLRPEIDAEVGTLQLSIAQPQWREVVQCLVRNSGKGPMDLSFVAPGAPGLGTACLRVDDTAPRLEAHLAELENGVIVGRSLLVWEGSDEIGLEELGVDVEFTSGRRLHLPLPGLSGSFGLGNAIGEQLKSVETLGGGTLVVRASDLAGNVSKLEPIAFEQADVGVPMVVDVTGPRGEGYVPWSGEQARLRVTLSALEANCSLHLYSDDGSLLDKLPLANELTQTIALRPPATNASAGTLDLVHLVDAFGNRSLKKCGLHWRDQTPRLDFDPVGPGVCRVGRELVLAPAGGVVKASAGENMAIVLGELELATAQGIRGAGAEFRSKAASDGTCRLEFGALPPGSHVLRCHVQEREGLPGVVGPQEVAVRVLPAAIEVRIPPVRSRFLRGLVDADLLARRGTGNSYREGPGWLVDPSMLPYLRGTLWVGADTRVPLPLPPRESPADPLLPEVTPISGHNVLAIDLRDVLDRPARLLAGDGVVEQVDHDGRPISVISDFWFNEDPPLLIGEELLGEHGQPARLELRFPLPFLPTELGELRLHIAQSVIAAADIVATGGDACIVGFELPFEVWSVAAGLLGKSREDFAEQLESKFEVTVESPARRYELTLRVRTTRSTLRPVKLADLDVRGALASIRLVPVLAPGRPFKEPVPEEAPPRAVFRPQVAVEVRNFSDILLQDRELCCGEARALMQQLDRLKPLGTPRRFVHDADPLGVARLSVENLLPTHARTAPDGELLSGVDFFQAYTLCRLLGQAVADDPALFRLPLGCELELAAFGGITQRACHGVAAHGGAVDMRAFLAAAQVLARGAAPTAADTRAAGDRIQTDYGVDFLGLDFGVREWVMDLPHVTAAEDLIPELIADHSLHLARVVAMSEGRWIPPPALIVPLGTMGVVRGLALGEREGLVRLDGTRLDPGALSVVPGTVPGVLRTEQLLREGSLLSHGDDPRLARIGFRVVAAAAALAGLRGRR